jgi:nicotinamidase-related amidase
MPSSGRDSWKTRFRSFYYGRAPEPADPTQERGKLALLVIDVQNVYLKRPDPAGSGSVVVTKTTDSALTSTNLRLILNNLGISQVVCCGIFTDQCVSSTVRTLADESYSVIVVEDACAAGSDALHRQELEIINMIYCHVMSGEELLAYLP